ncbi:hypothetical protein L1887_56600 [Cichorium endivia]|nr:hypothetical protein L1887_56600 [Cichorium endivia]
MSLVFIVACLHSLGHYEERSFSEVMAAVLLEMQLYRQYSYESRREVVEMVVLLQATARLHCFWHAVGRTALCRSILSQVLVHFRASELGDCLANEVSDEVVIVLLEAVLSHTDGEKHVKDVAYLFCHAVNHRVSQLLEAGDFSTAHELAKCGLKLARHHRFYHKHVALGYKLAEYMAGIDVPASTSKKLSRAMRQTSRAITDEVLCALREAEIELVSLRLDDVRGLVRLLGAQSNYSSLEAVLEQLWRSREVQRSWEPATVVSVGHALVHAHVAAGHLDAALSLCDTLCYNLRHSGDGLDDEAVEASQLLAQLYTHAGRHDRAIGRVRGGAARGRRGRHLGAVRALGGQAAPDAALCVCAQRWLCQQQLDVPRPVCLARHARARLPPRGVGAACGRRACTAAHGRLRCARQLVPAVHHRRRTAWTRRCARSRARAQGQAQHAPRPPLAHRHCAAPLARLPRLGRRQDARRSHVSACTGGLMAPYHSLFQTRSSCFLFPRPDRLKCISVDKGCMMRIESIGWMAKALSASVRHGGRAAVRRGRDT